LLVVRYNKLQSLPLQKFQLIAALVEKKDVCYGHACRIFVRNRRFSNNCNFKTHVTSTATAMWTEKKMKRHAAKKTIEDTLP